MEENIQQDMPYSEPVTFIINGSKIIWTPDSESLSPDFSADSIEDSQEIIENIDTLINGADNGEGYIRVTPVGPFLSATTKDLYTVVWAINTIYGDEISKIKVIGNAPTLSDMDLGYSDDTDEDGNQILY